MSTDKTVKITVEVPIEVWKLTIRRKVILECLQTLATIDPKIRIRR